jgi:hypothetical protein
VAAAGVRGVDLDAVAKSNDASQNQVGGRETRVQVLICDWAGETRRRKEKMNPYGVDGCGSSW